MTLPRIKEILQLQPVEKQITAEGWIRTVRASKNVTFIEINDGSCLNNLQVIIESSFPDYEKVSEGLNNGCSVRIKGIIAKSSGKEQMVELVASEIALVGEAPVDEYPLQKKRHSFEFLREIAHLRPRTNTFGAIARIRNAMSMAIHKFFQDREFIYLHTPIISGSDCEGAGEMFRVTRLTGEEIVTSEKEKDYSADFFGKMAYLTVSGQLEGEVYACAMKNIYTFGPTFRAENSNTARHLAEFWMVEPEMAFCDIEMNMDVSEEFLKYIFSYLLDKCRDDMDFFNSRIQKGLIENLEIIIDSEFARITYTDAINILLTAESDFEFPVKWGIDLQSEHEKYLADKIYKKPVIIINYPREIKAFYMKSNSDGKTVRAMDIIVPRLGEIIGGSERETDVDKLQMRLTESGLNPDDYWWYIDLRRYGSVPHSGFGLGFERLIQFVTGMQNIRDVIPFPRTPKNLEF